MKSRIEKDNFLIKGPIAHRGLHTETIPENSKSAYLNAIEKGLPIEMDLQLTKDREVVCFHDDDLFRMTKVKGEIYDKTLSELKKLRLQDTDEEILTFEEFLSLVDGKVPVLIEYKNQREKGIIVNKTLPLLDGYKGEFAVQSFDPTIVAELRKKRPEFIRGQLVDRDFHKEKTSRFIWALLSHCLLNFMTKPDFINMNVKYLPLSKRMKRGKKVLCWTVNTKEKLETAKKYADGFVFERIDYD